VTGLKMTSAVRSVASRGGGMRAALKATAILAARAVLVACTGGPPPADPEDDLTADLERDLRSFLEVADTNDRVRAVLVQHRGEPVLEWYPSASADDYWDVESIGKSVMSTLLGIAIEQGHLDGVDQTLAELVPDYAADMTPDVAAVTLRELLSHTAGFAADGPVDQEPVFNSPDWVRFVLADPLPDAPVEESFAYSSAAAHLMSPILVESTGQTVLEYARDNLFAPLDIATEPAAEPVVTVVNGQFDPVVLAAYYAADFAWPTDPQGYHTGGGSLKLRPKDLIQLGQLYLDHGRRGDEEVVPATWIAQLTSPHVEVVNRHPVAHAYGLMWWLTRYDGDAAYEALGGGGQRLTVIPARDLVVAVASELDLRDPTAWGAAPSDIALHEMIDTYIAPRAHAHPLRAGPARPRGRERRHRARAAGSSHGAGAVRRRRGPRPHRILTHPTGRQCRRP